MKSDSWNVVTWEPMVWTCNDSRYNPKSMAGKRKAFQETVSGTRIKWRLWLIYMEDTLSIVVFPVDIFTILLFKKNGIPAIGLSSHPVHLLHFETFYQANFDLKICISRCQPLIMQHTDYSWMLRNKGDLTFVYQEQKRNRAYVTILLSLNFYYYYFFN